MPIIMVATDLSTRSDRALRRATLIARRSGAALHLVHVVDDDQPEALVEAMRREARSVTEALAVTVRQVDGVQCTSEVLTGDPFVRLAEVADSAGVTLLVMGPHRRQFLIDQFRGTTLERTLRRSHVPVLVANAVPSGGYGVAIVPTDLQPASGAISSRVRRLPLAGDLRFVALHVYDPVGQQMMSRALVPREQREADETEERRAAIKALAEFAAEHGLAETVQRQVRALTGSVASDIGMAAREAGADLIALSASNKGMMERAILGSVTEAVLRDSEIDVLVMPAPEAGIPSA